MAKTRDLFKKIRDPKGTFHAKMLGVLWRWTSRGGVREESKSGILSCFKTWSPLGLENSDASSRDKAVQKWSELKFSHRFGILGRR